MLRWELIGAVIGAGMASGREIASFFSQYGSWSVAGIAIAMIAMVFLSTVTIPVSWVGSWQERLWKLMFFLLLVITGGAMLSGAGEITALVITCYGAYWGGIIGTILLAWVLAHRVKGGLGWVSRILLGVFAVMIVMGLFIHPMEAVVLRETNAFPCLFRGLTYGGFNAALLIPLMQQVKVSKEEKAAAARNTGVTVFCLLMFGNLVLLRHPALMTEAIPFIRLASQIGRVGQYLGAACLYLAILSTLTACFRGLGRSWRCFLCIAVALIGFSGVVEFAYTILGGGCLLILLTAKFVNCSRKAFHSPANML